MSTNITSTEKLYLGIGFGFGILLTTIFNIYQFSYSLEIRTNLKESLKLNHVKFNGSMEEHIIPKDKNIILLKTNYIEPLKLTLTNIDLSLEEKDKNLPVIL